MSEVESRSDQGCCDHKTQRIGGVPVGAGQAVPLVGEPAAAGYRELLAAFEATLATAIESGFADAERETIWHYRWRLLRRHLQEVGRLW